jgi:DNA-binding transcriptional LysR family regulator
MNLSNRQLRYVCEVARLGSIQAASAALHISQTSILAAISIAEDVLEAKIFDRRPSRGVQITPAGERFVIAARALLAAGTEFEREIGGFAKGAPQTLRIACFEPFGSLFIAAVLRRFVDAYGPVDILLYEGDQVQLRNWLANGVVDLIVTYDIGPSFGDDRVSRICRVPAHALLPVGDPLARKDSVSIAELAQRPLVLLDLPQTSTYITTLFDVLATRPQVGFRTRSYETVRSAVSAGFGVAILQMRPSGHSAADGPGLVRRALTDVFPPPTLIVADIYGANKPAFVRALIDIVKIFFQELGPAGFSVATPEVASTLFDV